MKCFYHNDLDGRCAGSIVAQYENNFNTSDFYEVDYAQELPLDIIQLNEKVYFVDYSFKQNTIWQLEKILEKTKNIIWIDHHTSSFELENTIGYEWLKDLDGIRKNLISGAALTYMYLYNLSFDQIPNFVKLVSDYDCWQFKFDPNTTYFKLGIDMMNFDALDEVWKSLLFDNSHAKDLLDEIINKGQLVRKYVDQTNEYYREHFGYETEICGLKCFVINQKTNSWVFGEKYYEYPVVMTWVFNGKEYIYTLYSSDKNVLCNKIAEKFGGGGHQGAAGFQSDKMLFGKC